VVDTDARWWTAPYPRFANHAHINGSINELHEYSTDFARDCTYRHLPGTGSGLQSASWSATGGACWLEVNRSRGFAGFGKKSQRRVTMFLPRQRTSRTLKSTECDSQEKHPKPRGDHQHTVKRWTKIAAWSWQMQVPLRTRNRCVPNHAFLRYLVHIIMVTYVCS
jgi:hypothetical protein